MICWDPHIAAAGVAAEPVDVETAEGVADEEICYTCSDSELHVALELQRLQKRSWERMRRKCER